MTRRARLDAELVRRGLARSREQAAELVAAGQVRVPGRTSVKAATQVSSGDPIVVDEPAGETYVSRGGHKLAGALDVFEADGPGGRRAPGAGRRRLDRRLHRRAAAARVPRRWSASTSATASSPGRCRPTTGSGCSDRTNVRDLTPGAVGEPVDLVVADLSFISLRLVLPALVAVADADADLVPMVKPQFEVGREALGRRRRRPRAGAPGRRGRGGGGARRTRSTAWVWPA